MKYCGIKMEICDFLVRFGGLFLLMSFQVVAINIKQVENLPFSQVHDQENTYGVHRIRRFVVGATVAGRHEFPWIVNIRLATKVRPHCGGSLIDWDLIVTAAHCLHYTDTLEPIDKRNIILTAGDFNTSCIDKWEQTGYPESIVIHPEFQSTPILHDIALIKIKQKFNYTEAVQPIYLPSYNILEHVQEGMVIGWGSTETKPYSDVLLKAYIGIDKSFGCVLNDKKSQFCAGGDEIDSCQGDSGGPFMCRSKQYFLCGLVSFGPQNCGFAQGTYTNVYSYLDWIAENRRFKPTTGAFLTLRIYFIVMLFMTLFCLSMVYIGYKLGRRPQNNDAEPLVHFH